MNPPAPAPTRRAFIGRLIAAAGAAALAPVAERALEWLPTTEPTLMSFADYCRTMDAKVFPVVAIANDSVHYHTYSFFEPFRARGGGP